MNDVKWPAVVLSQEILEVYANEKFTERCSMKALDSGWFDNIIIIDSTGNLFQVEHVITTPAITRFNSVFFRLINKIFTIKLSHKLINSITLHEFKEMIIEQINLMEKASNRWSERGNVNALKKRIFTACDFRKVMQILTNPRYIPDEA